MKLRIFKEKRKEEKEVFLKIHPLMRNNINLLNLRRE